MNQTIKHAIIACHPSEASFTLSVARRYDEAVRAHGQPAKDVAGEWALLGTAKS